MYLFRYIKVFQGPIIFLSGKGYLSLIKCYQGNYIADPSFNEIFRIKVHDLHSLLHIYLYSISL